METNFVTRLTLLVGGAIVSAIGLVHIFMPAFGYDQNIPRQLDVEVRDHFYYLGTYAISSFLLSLGFISIFVSRLKYPSIVFVFSFLFSLLWTARTLMEIKYPVKLKLFFLNTPTTVLLPVLIFIAIIYTIGAVSHLIYKPKQAKFL